MHLEEKDNRRLEVEQVMGGLSLTVKSRAKHTEDMVKKGNGRV